MNSTSKEIAPSAGNPFGPVVAAPTGASALAMAQRETTEVQSAMLIARQFPRDTRASMDRILMSFTRQTLAEDALYSYSRGGQEISGLSIRAAEELGRQWGNIDCGVYELTRYGGQSEVLTYAMDLETGFRDSKRFMVRHWRDTKKGGHPVTEERDIYEVVANMGARRKRACILACIPIDVQEAAIKQIELTLVKGQAAVTTEGITKMLEQFAPLGVTKVMIEKKIQRRIESITPQGMIQMRKIFASIRDQMSGASDWFEMPQGTVIDAGEDNSGAPPATGNEAAKQALRQGTPPAATATAATPAAAEADYIPQFSDETAITAFKAAKNLEELRGVWKAVRADYKASGREVGLSVESTFIQLREQFQEEL